MTRLSTDRPGTDPAEDLLGHADFARNLAKSIGANVNREGLVLALYGPWGSGKTTALSYVRHYLAGDPSTRDIVVVDFNPWWFAGRDDLAQALLGQLQAILPGKSKKLKDLGTLIGDFADNIGGLIDLVGMTGGAAGLTGKLLSKIVKRQPKDVPALKAKIARVLRGAQVRIVVMVDDIDRLDDAEVRRLFTVIKALADFPYVTYVLAFDYEVATKAVEGASHLPGTLYLEKIIQVPFHLPLADKTALRSMLFSRLNSILALVPGASEDFDGERWGNVYLDGIDPLIRVPRDIVRLTNTLSVTYPSVATDVNAVDFIAVEAMRVFLPQLYEVVRANPERFAGHSADYGTRQGDEEAKAFHDKWKSEIPVTWKQAGQLLIERLFPKTGRVGYGSDWLRKWRKELLVCHPENFPVYFRLSLPRGTVGNAEMTELVASTAEPDRFQTLLLNARDVKRPDGIAKSRELLDRLMDYAEKDIPDERLPATIEALLEIGDRIIDPSPDGDLFDIGDDRRVARLVYHLLKRVPDNQRLELLRRVATRCRGLLVLGKVIFGLDEEHTGARAGPTKPLVEQAGLDEIKSLWAPRVRALFGDASALSYRGALWLLGAWERWGVSDDVRQASAALIQTDAGLLEFVRIFLQHPRSIGAGDRVTKSKPRLNPTWLASFVDVESVGQRLQRLHAQGPIPENARTAVSQFLKERSMLAAGKNPDDWRLGDEDE